MSGKQWAGRLVAIVQLACWCSVSGLLLNRGISNLTTGVFHIKRNPYVSQPYIRGCCFNKKQEQEVGRPARGFTAGVIMVSVSCIMLLLSPTFLLMKIIDLRRRRHILLQLAHDDLPPRYDQVVERAPRYSSLFLVSESGEVRLLNESRPATIVPCRSEEAPRYSSLFIVNEKGDVHERKSLTDRRNEAGNSDETDGNEGESIALEQLTVNPNTR